VASLLVPEVQVALGADGPPRYQQPGILGHDRIGMDDAKIDPGHSIMVHITVPLDGDDGSDRQP